MSINRFFIRTDASSVIGGGHFVRCLNLARRLNKDGCKITFLSRNLEEKYLNQAEEAGFNVTGLPTAGQMMQQDEDDYSTWLGTGQVEDISQCLSLIGDEENFGFIVDHYGVGIAWLRRAREVCGKTIVFDDLAERRLAADILINQNLGWDEKDYFDLVEKDTKLLLGPEFAILADNFAKIRENSEHEFKISTRLKVLVSLGASDVHNLSGEVVRALLSFRLVNEFTVTIIVGPMNPNLEMLERLRRTSGGRVTLLTGSNNLAEVIASHDFAIGAVGGSSWERCCLGLPTIMIPIAANQYPAADKLHNAGAGILVDYWDEKSDKKLYEAFKCMCNPDMRAGFRQAAMKVCDGRGADRVAKTILYDKL